MFFKKLKRKRYLSFLNRVLFGSIASTTRSNGVIYFQEKENEIFIAKSNENLHITFKQNNYVIARFVRFSSNNLFKVKDGEEQFVSQYEVKRFLREIDLVKIDYAKNPIRVSSTAVKDKIHQIKQSLKEIDFSLLTFEEKHFITSFLNDDLPIIKENFQINQESDVLSMLEFVLLKINSIKEKKLNAINLEQESTLKRAIERVYRKGNEYIK